MKTLPKYPELRFPEFENDWVEERIDWFIERANNPVDVKKEESYREIGVRSHGKGIFHKPTIKGKELGDKRVFWVHSNAFVVNIVFAWEQAVALTTNNEDGFIASHRFPMFVPRENRTNLQFLLRFFLRARGKHLLGLASPGGAGRNKTLGQSEFAKLKIVAPKVAEQQKIATFLSAIDDKLKKLRRKRELLETYKSGLMQKLFSQEIRFKQEDGSDFLDWKKCELQDVFSNKKGRGLSKDALVDDGLNKCILYGELYTTYPEIIKEVLSRTNSTDGVKSAAGDILIPCSTTTSRIDLADATVVEEKDVFLGGDITILRMKDGGDSRFYAYYLNHFKKFDLAKYGQGSTIIHLYFDHFKKVEFFVPEDVEEQNRIATSISALEEKNLIISNKINRLETFKKGLLQKMFV